MSDHPGEPASARAAALEIELETAMSLSRATANALRELSPEASAVFRRQLQRELNRLKLAGPGGVDVAAMRLRAFLD
jgi:BMFP domain-containing protein YqiC